MKNQFNFICIIINFILLSNNSSFAQEKKNMFPDLILIEKLPNSSDVLSLKMIHLFNKELSQSDFLIFLDKAKPVSSND